MKELFSSFKTLATRVAASFLPLSVMIMAVLIAPSQTYAQAITIPWTEPCYATRQVTMLDGSTENHRVATIQGFRCIVANVLSVATSFIGLAGFVMFLVGGFQYLLSGGNSKGPESAKNTLTAAVTGIIIALSAFMILNLIKGFTGVDRVTQFDIPLSTDGIPGGRIN